MNCEHSADVEALFAGQAQDWTPEPARRACRVIFVPVSPGPSTSLCARIISDSERETGQRFITAELACHFYQRRAFRRFCAKHASGSSALLSEIVIDETIKGRPFLPEARDIWLSFSSCEAGFLGAWSSTHAVGVDLETIKPLDDISEMAQRYFSSAEAKAVTQVDGRERLERFFRFWTLKEAALKSIGEGLPFGLHAFRFELGPKLRVVDVPTGHPPLKDDDVHIVEAPDICAAVVLRSRA